MIESLHLEGIAVVEKAELELGPGLNVLTGETGAGKSIILGALSLLVGGKARAETLREGCDTGRVEAVFATRDKASLEKDLVRLGLECEDDKNRSLVVGRTLQRAGQDDPLLRSNRPHLQARKSPCWPDARFCDDDIKEHKRRGQ